MAERVAPGHLKINDENSGVDPKYDDDDNTKEKSPQTEASSRYDIAQLVNIYKDFPRHDHQKCIEKQKAAIAARKRKWRLARQEQFPNKDGDEFISIQARKKVPELSFKDSLLALCDYKPAAYACDSPFVPIVKKDFP